MLTSRSPILPPGAPKHGRLALGICVAMLATSLPAAAASYSWNAPTRVLGNDGQIFELHVGSYGELFPEYDDKGAQLGLMALDVRTASGDERLVVPGTDTWRPERYPMLSYDHRSDSLMVFWATGGHEDGRWSFNFATYSAGEWTEVSQVEADGVPVLAQGAPRVAVTSDDFTLDLGPDETPFETRRTTFHIVWLNGDDGVVRYAPVSFMDGVHAGWSETLSLRAAVLKTRGPAEGDAVNGDLVPAFLPSSLVDALSLERAREADAVALTLTDRNDGSLVTLRIEEVPMSLAFLAQRVRDFIEEALDAPGSVNVGSLAEEIRAEIIGVGAKCRLNPAVNQFLASEMADWVLTHRDDLASSGAQALALEAWQRTLETGSSVLNKTKMRPDQKDDAVELAALAVPETHLEELNQLIRIRARGYFQAPDAVGEGEADIFASDDGQALLVTWLDAESQTLSYVENHGAGWSETSELKLGDDLSLAAALDLLRHKIR